LISRLKKLINKTMEYYEEDFFLKKLASGIRDVGRKLDKKVFTPLDKGANKLIAKTLGEKTAAAASAGGIKGIAAGIKVAAPIAIAASAPNIAKIKENLAAKMGGPPQIIGTTLEQAKKIGATLGGNTASLGPAFNNILKGIDPSVQKSMANGIVKGFPVSVGDILKNNQTSPELLPKTKPSVQVEKAVTQTAIQPVEVFRPVQQLPTNPNILTASGINLGNSQTIIVVIAVILLAFLLFRKNAA
jgi:hypothetical protein